MAVCLYRNLMYAPEDSDQWIFKDPHQQARRALECLDEFLARVPDAASVRYNKFILIRESVSFEIQLGDMDDLRSWTESYLAERLEREPGPRSTGASISYWWILFKKDRDREQSFGNAEALVETLPPGGLPELDRLEYESVIACLVVARRYSDAVSRLRERLFLDDCRGPLGALVEFHNMFAGGLPYVEPDIEGLRTFLEDLGPEEDLEDRLAALEKLER